MHKINLFSDIQKPKILCLGAHADDIEIGCGGTILDLSRNIPKLSSTGLFFQLKANEQTKLTGAQKAFLAISLQKL